MHAAIIMAIHNMTLSHNRLLRYKRSTTIYLQIRSLKFKDQCPGIGPVISQNRVVNVSDGFRGRGGGGFLGFHGTLLGLNLLLRCADDRLNGTPSLAEELRTVAVHA